MALKDWFRPSRPKRAAHDLLAQVIERAREPVFYTRAGAPDTLDGRWDMITLHTVLVLHRLKGERCSEVQQYLFDAFFANMDDSLREMGVGDMSIPKKIKTMSEAFYGRIKAYDPPLTEGDAEALALAITRNVYRCEAETPDEGGRWLADYMLAQKDVLAGQADDELLDGRLTFAPVDAAA